MHRRFLSTSSAVSALAIGGSLAGLMALSSFGMGAQGQSDFFLNAGGDGGTGGTGGTGGGTTGGTQGNQGGSGSSNTGPTVEQLQSRLTALEGERDTLKTERDEFKGKLDADATAKLTEKERLEKERDDAKKDADAARESVKQSRAEVAIGREANKIGIDSALAIRLVTVEFDKDGQPKDVEKAVKKLAEDHPELVKQEETTTGGGSSPARGRSGNQSDKPKTMAEALAAREAAKNRS